MTRGLLRYLSFVRYDFLRNHILAMKPPSSSKVSLTTQSHYQGHTAQSYESAFFYEKGAYTEWLANKVQDKLRLTASLPEKVRLLVDVGGGTGNFTKMLLDVNRNQLEAVVVDPFLAEEHSDSSNYRIGFVKAAAESFQVEDENDTDWWRRGYHQILMKEVVHHFDANDRVGIFIGMRNGTVQLSPEFPALLIVTRPQLEVDYPLWPAARQVWASHQPSFDEIKLDLERAGYLSVEQSMEIYPCSIPLERWLSMVKGRFWSTFSNFTDEELNEACKLMPMREKERIDEDGNIHFEDRLLFITAGL